MKIRRCCLLFLIFSIPLIVSSQNNYFIRDTVTAIGASVVDGGSAANQRTCTVAKVGGTTVYTPWQVSEYGFEDGRTYLARKITLPDSVQKVFLERLVKGRCNVYYYEGREGITFFLEKDSTLFVELPKHGEGSDGVDFRDDLRHYTADCPKMADAIQLVRYNRAGYQKFMSRYEKCQKKPFPFFKFGLTAGVSVSNLLPKPSISIPEINQLEYGKDTGFVVGLFLECPVLLSDISLAVELLYTQHEYSGMHTIRGEEFDFYGKTSSLQMPVLVRYTPPLNIIRPFVNAGGVFQVNLNPEDALYSASVSQNVVQVNGVNETSLIRKAMLGFSLGGGATVQIFPRNLFSIEIRYNKLYALQTSQAMNMSEIQLITRISF